MLLLFLGIGSTLSCVTEYNGIAPDPTKIHYPIGISVHPNGRFLYVANSNFDLAYTGGTIMVFDTNEDSEIIGDVNGVKQTYKTLRMLEGATVEIGAFAGQLLLDREGKRGYVAVRNDRKEGSPIGFSSITYFDIDIEKEGEGHLSCLQKPVKKEETGGVGEEGKFELTPAPRCSNESKVFLHGKRCDTDDDCIFLQQERCLRDSAFLQGENLNQQGYCTTQFYPYSLVMGAVCTARRSCDRDEACACSEAQKAAGICRADERCDEGRCVTGCSEDGQCSKGQRCLVGRCRYPLPSAQSCLSDLDCLLEERCHEERCETRSCTNASDCPSGLACLEGLCLRKRCSRDLDCPVGTRCDEARCVEGCREDSACLAEESCVMGRCRTRLSEIPRYCELDQSCAPYEVCKDTRLFASHIERGAYSSIELEKLSLPPTSTERRELGMIQERVKLELDLELPLGMTGLALLPNTNELGGEASLFLSSRQSNRVFALPLKDRLLTEREIGQIAFNNPDMTSTGLLAATPTFADMRGITVATNRKHRWSRLFVASRQPPAVLVYDLRRERPDTPISMRLIASLPVGEEPAHLLYRHRPAPEADLLYVVCSRRGRVDVFDAEALQMRYQIPAGERPYFIAIHDPKPDAPVQRARAYVANFLNTTISIIDLQNHQVIGLVTGIDTTLKIDP